MLDKNKNVIGEQPIVDKGCGFSELTFTDQVATYSITNQSYVNNEFSCESHDVVETYEINGKIITFEFKDNYEEDTTVQEIVTLTDSTLILLDLDELEKEGVEGEGFLEGIVYEQIEYKKRNKTRN